jgi:hypothetical protein
MKHKSRPQFSRMHRTPAQAAVGSRDTSFAHIPVPAFAGFVLTNYYTFPPQRPCHAFPCSGMELYFDASAIRSSWDLGTRALWWLRQKMVNQESGAQRSRAAVRERQGRRLRLPVQDGSHGTVRVAAASTRPVIFSWPHQIGGLGLAASSRQMRRSRFDDVRAAAAMPASTAPSLTLLRLTTVLADVLVELIHNARNELLCNFRSKPLNPHILLLPQNVSLSFSDLITPCLFSSAITQKKIRPPP